MPALADHRRELFAQNLARVMPAVRAYQAAGYRPDPANAARLTRNDHVRTRLAELMAVTAEDLGVTVKRVINGVARIAFANMADFIAFGPNVDPTITLDGLTWEQFATVGELNVVQRVVVGKDDTPSVTIKRVRFKLHDKLAALDKLGRYFGIWDNGADKHAPNETNDKRIKPVHLDALSIEELKTLRDIKRKLDEAASQGPHSRG
jgi:phage terminase small subunit